MEHSCARVLMCTVLVLMPHRSGLLNCVEQTLRTACNEWFMSMMDVLETLVSVSGPPSCVAPSGHFCLWKFRVCHSGKNLGCGIVPNLQPHQGTSTPSILLFETAVHHGPIHRCTLVAGKLTKTIILPSCSIQNAWALQCYSLSIFVKNSLGRYVGATPSFWIDKHWVSKALCCIPSSCLLSRWWCHFSWVLGGKGSKWHECSHQLGD